MLFAAIPLLIVVAFLLIVAHASWGRVPLWIPVLLMSIAQLLGVVPR